MAGVHPRMRLFVLMAYVIRRAFPLFDCPVPLEGMSLGDELRLSWRIFWRVVVVLYIAAVLAGCFGLSSDAPYFMWGLTGVAFNQLSFIGRAWAAVIAALVLLMILGADRDTGKPAFAAAFRRLAEHGLRFGTTVAALAVFYIGWGTIQILLFNAIWSIPLFGGADPRTKGLIFFAVTFVFAFVRLWATLLILTSGLKPSAIGNQAAATASSSNRP
jgi:hypothetical protein